MSWQMLAWAAEQHTGSPTRKAVLIALANRTNHDTGACFPSVRRIAEETEMSERTVTRALADLVEAGFVEKHGRKRDDGSTASTSYTFPHVDSVSPAPVTVSPAPPDTVTPAPGDTVSPHEPGRDEPGRDEPQSTDGELALASAETVARYDPRKGTKIDGRNLPWDALVRATSADEVVEKGRLAKALKLIRGYVVDAHAEQAFDDERGEHLIASQITARARLYRDRWPDIELTPTALAANWSRVVVARPGADLDGALDAAQRGLDAARGGAT